MSSPMVMTYINDFCPYRASEFEQQAVISGVWTYWTPVVSLFVNNDLSKKWCSRRQKFTLQYITRLFTVSVISKCMKFLTQMEPSELNQLQMSVSFFDFIDWGAFTVANSIHYRGQNAHRSASACTTFPVTAGISAIYFARADLLIYCGNIW